MATTNAANTANSLDTLMGLYKVLAGSKGTSSTTTSSTSAEAINAAVQDALSSTRGLANTVGAQKVAGLYGSSTNKMLASKLIADTAAAAAKGNVTQTTTTAGSKGLGAGGIAALMGLKALSTSKVGNQLIGDQSGGTNIVDTLTDALGITGATGAGMLTAPTASAVSQGTSDAVSQLMPAAFDYTKWKPEDFDIASAGTGAADVTIPDVSGIADVAISDVGSDFASTASDAALSAAVEGAGEAIGGSASYDIGSLVGDIGSALGFACGGRVEKKNWADGGRVNAFATGSGSVSPVLVQLLNRYSYAQRPQSSIADQTDTTDLSTVNGGMDAQGNANALGSLVAALSDITGMSMEDTAGIVAGAGKTAANVGIGLSGLGLSGLTGLGITATGAWTAAKDALTQAGLDARQADIDAKTAKSVEDQLALETSREALGFADITTARAGEVDSQVAAEAASRGEAPADTVGSEAASPSADSYSTSPDSDTSGWGGFSSEDSTYANGGRVHGDSQEGKDDVAVPLGPNMGGGVGGLDGGEVVIKASSVDKIDRKLGRKFLDTLNSNPDALIAHLMGR